MSAADPTVSDVALLERVLDLGTLSDEARKAFEDMQHRGAALTAKQRAWVEAALEGKHYDPEPEYRNDWSAGRVPRGREVETPAVLLNLPKKPPTRVAR